MQLSRQESVAKSVYPLHDDLSQIVINYLEWDWSGFDAIALEFQSELQPLLMQILANKAAFNEVFAYMRPPQVVDHVSGLLAFCLKGDPTKKVYP